MIKRLLRLVGRWARKPVNHTSWVAVVTPTDRPKSVRNRCLIELFCGVVCVVTLPFWHFCWCRGFCHRTESDLFLFLLREKEEIWLSPMTEALTPTEKSKKQRDNTKNATKNFDYTTIADRLRTVSWGNDSHPAGVVKPVYGIPTFPLTAKAV